jgi:hypothetical protein
VLEPVYPTAFMIDAQEGRKRCYCTELRRQFVNLVEAFNVPLKEMETAGLDEVQKGIALLVEFVTLEPQNEQLSNLLFQSKAVHIPHWITQPSF